MESWISFSTALKFVNQDKGSNAVINEVMFIQKMFGDVHFAIRWIRGEENPRYGFIRRDSAICKCDGCIREKMKGGI